MYTGETICHISLKKIDFMDSVDYHPFYHVNMVCPFYRLSLPCTTKIVFTAYGSTADKYDLVDIKTTNCIVAEH